MSAKVGKLLCRCKDPAAEMSRPHYESISPLNNSFWESQVKRELLCSAPTYGKPIDIWLAIVGSDSGQ